MDNISNQNGTCLGLVGGLGVGAAVYYYEKLAAALGSDLNLVMVHAQVSEVYSRVDSGDKDGLAAYLNGLLSRCKAAGANFGIIPALTPHYCLAELEATSPLALISIFKPLVKELAARSVRRVAVFGTRFVMESAIFGQITPVDVIVPKPAELEFIHETYISIARTGKFTDAQFRGLTDLAKTFCSRDEADAVLLAGTDLTLVFNDSNTEFPAIDCAALHIGAIVAAVRAGRHTDSDQPKL